MIFVLTVGNEKRDPKEAYVWVCARCGTWLLTTRLADLLIMSQPACVGESNGIARRAGTRVRQQD